MLKAQERNCKSEILCKHYLLSSSTNYSGNIKRKKTQCKDFEEPQCLVTFNDLNYL